MELHDDVIAAPATPPSVSAVGILRLSGPHSDQLAGRVFYPASGAPLSAVTGRVMTRGKLRDADGRVFDHCMACVMRAPNSYTGETVVELYTHGSPAVMSRALELLYQAGARPAQPGEFTRRALLNGKLDLMQAEAVADIIEAPTARAASNAAGFLEGGVSRGLDEVWDTLTGVMAQVAACADYPEDDVPEITELQILERLRRVSSSLASLGATYRRGMALRDGVGVVIAGCPNAGKSSLFNALLGCDRAIVTPVPGTTRDVIEASVTLGGLRFRLMDTAGIRGVTDQVEAEGVRRAESLLCSSQMALVVLDASRPVSEDERRILKLTEPKPRVVALNKSDLADTGYPGAVRVSALTGDGLDELAAALSGAVSERDDPRLAGGETLLTNARHARAVGEALEAVDNCAKDIENGVPADVALGLLESALEALGELTGRSAGGDILEQIFSRFCVGK